MRWRWVGQAPGGGTITTSPSSVQAPPPAHPPAHLIHQQVRALDCKGVRKQSRVEGMGEVRLQARSCRRPAHHHFLVAHCSPSRWMMGGDRRCKYSRPRAASKARDRRSSLRGRERVGEVVAAVCPPSPGSSAAPQQPQTPPCAHHVSSAARAGSRDARRSTSNCWWVEGREAEERERQGLGWAEGCCM